MCPPRYLFNSPHSYDCSRWPRGWLVKKPSHCSLSVISEIVIVMQLDSTTFLLQKFASKDTIDAHIAVFAETKNGLAHSALVLEAGLLVGPPASDIFFHIQSLYAIEIQLHEAVA